MKKKTFFSFFSRKENQTQEKIYNINPDSFLSYIFGNGGWISDYMAHDFYRSTSAVATSVDMIAGAGKQITPVIETPDGKFIKKHKILSLLHHPNGFDDWPSFAETVLKNYLLKHDSLILASGNTRFDPIELWPVALQDVSITQGIDNYPEKYYVTQGMLIGNYERTKRFKEFRFYDGNLKELYHIRGYCSRHVKTESDSPLQAAAQEARQIIKGKYHNIKLLDNGGRLSLLVTFNDDDYISTEEHESRRQRLQEQFGGGTNAGIIGVVSGADIQHVKEFGKSNKDMDFATLEEMAGYAIYLRYNIPLAIVTIKASTFNNLETGVGLLYDNAVMPNISVVFSALTRMLMPRFGLNPEEWKITYNPESIEPLKQRKLDELNKRQKMGVETINEIRSLLPGREPIEGGDVLYRRSNMEPVGKDRYTADNNNT